MNKQYIVIISDVIKTVKNINFPWSMPFRFAFLQLKNKRMKERKY